MRTLLLACVFAAAIAAPSFARDDVRISTAGLDLSNEADVSRLHARIERAAEAVCRDNGRITLRSWRERNACVAEKMDKAVRSANLPTLTALHAELKQTTRS